LDELLAERRRLLGMRPEQDEDGGDEEEESRRRQPDDVRVWGHDPTVAPGKTYRYRLRVSVLNPLFRRSEVAPEQRQKYMNMLDLDSVYSDWTEPVRVEPARHFFVVGTAEQGGLAEVEVWRIFNGRWRSRRFQVAPGDPMGERVTVELDGGDRAMDMRLGSVAVEVLQEQPAPGRLQGTTARLLFEDEEGTLKHRDVARDRAHPKREALQRRASRP
jgi:hypothetical protein